MVAVSAGEKSFIEPPEPEAVLSNPDLGMPIIIAAVVGVLTVILIAIAVTAIARRR